MKMDDRLEKYFFEPLYLFFYYDIMSRGVKKKHARGWSPCAE